MTLYTDSAKPVLRLNLPLHSNTIWSISSDASARYILTSSDDKTARLWDAQSGELLKVFRVFIAEGDEGKLYAGAISPDAKLLAVGGWTEFRSAYEVYILNTETGEILQRISGLDNVILHLEFHGDGRLALAMFSGGIRIFAPSHRGYILEFKDNEYSGSSYNVTFDSRGRFASVAYDGYVRLYDNSSGDYRLIKKQKTRGGREPYSLSFSADGGKIAVGYSDSGTVDVLHGETLELLYQPDTSEAISPYMALSFSSDGFLYGGGSTSREIDGKMWTIVRCWNNEGLGSYKDFKATGNAILNLKNLGDGSLLVSGSQPDFGLYKADGTALFYQRTTVPDFRNSDRFKYFTVNEDGSQISFKSSGKESMVFNLAERTLYQSGELFKLHREGMGNLNISHWKDSYSPRLNGWEMNFLKEHEMSRSVDIADDGTLIFGTSWCICALDSTGRKKWKVSVLGDTWAVNISGNGRVAVAAHDGGEIRWYRMEDGEHLLSLFVHPGDGRWILWTPQGYYDASPGADTLVGWHLNQGRDAVAKFFPLSHFASQYYRPNLLADILQFADVDKALLHAQDKRKKAPDVTGMLPPEVRIISPKNNEEFASNTVLVRYHIETSSGEDIRQVHVSVDGRSIGALGILQPLDSKKRIGEITVPVPSRDCKISLVAENRYSFSEAAIVSLRWRGETEFLVKPKLYVLAIGVSEYENADLRLGFAAKDAGDFAQVLQNQRGKLYRDVVIKPLVDGHASRGEILDGFDWILRETTQNDMAMVFFAGHGVNDDYGNYYFLPQETDVERIRSTAVPYSEIKTAMADVAGKALFFIDSCYSGNVMGNRRAVRDINGIVNDLSSAENAVVVFAASTGNQFSLECEQWGNGAFTLALIEAFSGKAAQEGIKITISMLERYVAERVKELTDGRQTPTTAKPCTITDFPVAVI